MKKFTCMFLLLSLIFTTTAFAEEPISQETYAGYQTIDVEYLPDGSYVETVIFDDRFAGSSMVREITPFTAKTVTKSKVYNYKNASGKIMWYVKVTGTFTYGNGSAKCTASTPSAKSNNSSWSVSKATGKRSGNWCSATATGKHRMGNGEIGNVITKTIKLTCSPTGVFS